MSVSTRRAALGAILAAPMASVPVAAALSTLSGDEARFLALAPRIVPMLDRFDRIWAAAHEFYEAWDAAQKKLNTDKWTEKSEHLPEWHAYVAARAPSDEIDEAFAELYQPFEDVRFVSFEAIMLRFRIGMSFDHLSDDASDDMEALWRARGCA